MVQSVELLLDESGEDAVRAQWRALAAAGFGAGRPDHRPHVTLTVAREIWPRIDKRLEHLTFEPFELRIGAPTVFGDRRPILVRTVVPSLALLDVHSRVHAIVPGALSDVTPGHWTPHVTLARRIDTDRLGAAVLVAAAFPEVDTRAIGVRRWDGDRRVEWRIA